ncbi:MAG: serine/threonine protein kinase [Kofleriaceae bacterium]
MSDPLLGTEVGRYRIERLLGEGGMGAVYLAEQPMIGSRVAIKVLSQECARSPELLERFFAEARSVNLIRHENIVSVLDLARLPDGRPYIVMEFIEGQTIGQIIRATIAQGQRVPIGGIVQVAVEMLSALGAAHALGIVHRDLKPDNVLVTAEGHAKVLDFGIAKLAPGLNQHSPRTRTGALLGTPSYMAPEQISGTGQVDPRTDIYAAGVVLFEAITGTQPFVGETLFDLMRAHMEHAPPSPRERRPEMPLAFEHVILTALAKDPARRFQSAGAMAQALRQAAQELQADQWRSLSGRSLSGGRISFDQIRVPTPHTDPARSPTYHATPIPQDVARTERRPPSRRGLYGAIAGITIVGVIVGAIVLTRPKTDRASGAAPGSNIVASNEIGSAAGGSDVSAPAGPGGAPIEPTNTGIAPSNTGSNAAPSGTAPSNTAPSNTGSNAAPSNTAPSGSNAAPSSTAPPNTTRAPSSNPTRTGSAAPSSTTVPTGTTTPPPTTTATAVGSTKSVDISPGVTLIQAVPPPGAPKKITQPFTGNPKKFDAMAFAPKALALARQLYPDAGFTRLDTYSVFPNGLTDLTIGDDETTYWFRSPSNSARPAGIPKNQEVEIFCYVEVEVSAKQVEAWVREISIDANCKAPIRPLPKCSLAGVWAKAKAQGAEADTIAKIGFLTDGEWFFDNDGDDYEGLTESFADKCP